MTNAMTNSSTTTRTSMLAVLCRPTRQVCNAQVTACMYACVYVCR